MGCAGSKNDDWLASAPDPALALASPASPNPIAETEVPEVDEEAETPADDDDTPQPPTINKGRKIPVKTGFMLKQGHVVKVRLIRI